MRSAASTSCSTASNPEKGSEQFSCNTFGWTASQGWPHGPSQPALGLSHECLRSEGRITRHGLPNLRQQAFVQAAFVEQRPEDIATVSFRCAEAQIHGMLADQPLPPVARIVAMTRPGVI